LLDQTQIKMYRRDDTTVTACPGGESFRRGSAEAGEVETNIADGDGLIVVPREHTLTVGKLAREINLGDEKNRANRFKRLGIEPDQTVIVE
jgi:hypothetical protein